MHAVSGFGAKQAIQQGRQQGGAKAGIASSHAHQGRLDRTPHVLVRMAAKDRKQCRLRNEDMIRQCTEQFDADGADVRIIVLQQRRQRGGGNQRQRLFVTQQPFARQGPHARQRMCQQCQQTFMRHTGRCAAQGPVDEQDKVDGYGFKRLFSVIQVAAVSSHSSSCRAMAAARSVECAAVWHSMRPWLRTSG